MTSGDEKRPLVALHGFLGLPGDWAPVFAGAPEFSIDAVDLWPMVRSLYSVNGFASWCRDFLARDFFKFKINNWAGGAEKPVLLGYSMGGRLAMHAAIKAPERWSAAIFVSAHPGLGDDAEREARVLSDQVWARRFREETWTDVLKAWNGQAVLQPPPADIAPEALSLAPRVESEFDREALACAMEFWSLGRQDDLRERLHALPIPVLYLTGALDTKFTTLMKAMELPRHHRHEVVPGAGHRVPWDQAAEFRARVWEFAI